MARGRRPPLPVDQHRAVQLRPPERDHPPAAVRVAQPALPRNTGVTFPAGLIGSATAVQPCSMNDFLTTTEVYNHCPDSAAVGAASVTMIEQRFRPGPPRGPDLQPEPARGEPARFGFMPVGVPVLIDTSVDPSDYYRIPGVVRNAPQAPQVLSATITIWGVPRDTPRPLARPGLPHLHPQTPLRCERSPTAATSPRCCACLSPALNRCSTRAWPNPGTSPRAAYTAPRNPRRCAAAAACPSTPRYRTP